MSSSSPGVVPYRCVCGQVFSVDARTGGNCPTCQRRVSTKAFAGRLAETVSFQVTGDDSLVQAQLVEPSDADDQTGRSYGHYRVVRKLGQGGMGAVYEAVDESLQRYVALKVLHATNRSGADTKQIQRLLQEAIAQARVNHPNIVHIYFVGQEDKTPFFAMELVPGATVADRLEDGPLPFSEVIEIGAQVVDALRHAADFDIVHGDVKPSNILTADSTTVKLSDFGLARRLSQIERDPVFVAGTPNYLSPEAAEGKPLDIRSDIYSLGITLFELTFGRLPYSLSGSDFRDYVRIHRTAPIQFPEPWPESVPEGWRGVLERLLAKSPEDRYQTYGEVSDALRRFRPVSLSSAGRVHRGFAWIVDLALAFAPLGLFSVLLQLAGNAVGSSGSGPFAQLSLTIFGALVLLLAAFMQSRWKTTPGKRLFQLRIVDRHGMTPSRSILAFRSVFQFLPMWAWCAFLLYATLGRQLLAGYLVFLAVGWSVLDIGSALFRRGGRSLHDSLTRTRVVLDAGDTHTVTPDS